MTATTAATAPSRRTLLAAGALGRARPAVAGAAIGAAAAVCAAVGLLAASQDRTWFALAVVVPAVIAAWLLMPLGAVLVTVAAEGAALAALDRTGAGAVPGAAIAALTVATALAAHLAARRLAVESESRRRDRLVAQIGRIAVSGEALPAILDRILTEMAREGLRGGLIALINERNELYVAGYEGDLDAAVRTSRIPVGRGIMGTVAAEGRAIIVDDFDRPGPVVPMNRNLGSNAAMRSMVAVPIKSDGEVLGVLEIDSQRPHQFGEDDVVLLERIALAISAAVQQIGPLKLANDLLRRRVRELTEMQEAARGLTASLDLDAVLGAVAVYATRALEVGFATVVDLEGQTARAVATAIEGRLQYPLPPASPRREATELQAVADSGELRAFDHVPGGPGLAAAADHLALRRAAAVPLAAAATRMVLVAATDDERGFDPAQMAVLQSVAHLGGLAVANAQSYRRLQDMAATDALTGLYNVAEFERRLAGPHPDVISVIAIDIDRLKDVNDQYGHEAGDAILRRVGDALVGQVGDRGVVARTGGDEFAVLLVGMPEDEAVVLAERLRETMHGVAVPYGLARISAGSASGPVNAEPREVWWAAEEALFQAKRYGRDRIEIARANTSTLQSPVRRWDAVVAELLDKHGVEAVFQPVLRLHDRATVAFEALARPRGMPAGTDVEGLFAAAHRIGLARDLDWLCRRAAVDCAREIPSRTPLFINVGVWAMLDPLHDVDQMLLLLRWAGRSPRDTVLEITEREVISDLARFEAVLAAYREHGFRFAIDDVGEGHSTLEVLAAASPEFVKIARSLTVAHDRVGARSAIRAVVAFARSVGAQVIAEGVETEDDAGLIAGLGVDLGQGYWLGRPARWADLPEDLRIEVSGGRLPGAPLEIRGTRLPPGVT